MLDPESSETILRASNQRLAQFRFRLDPEDRRSQCATISRWDEKAGNAILDDLGNTSGIGGYDGQAAFERFENHRTQPLVIGRECQHIRGGEPVAHIRSLAYEV